MPQILSFYFNRKIGNLGTDRLPTLGLNQCWAFLFFFPKESLILVLTKILKKWSGFLTSFCFQIFIIVPIFKFSLKQESLVFKKTQFGSLEGD